MEQKTKESRRDDDLPLTKGLSPAPNPNGETRLWIGNLNNKKVTAEAISGMFSGVKFVQLVSDPKGRPKGFAFAEMRSAEDAGRAVGAGGKVWMGRGVKVNYQKWDGKSAWPPPDAVHF